MRTQTTIEDGAGMVITLGSLNAHPHIRHGFFTREGGCSAGLYASLNCGPGSDDDPQNVAANRTACLERLGLAEAPLLTVRQVHSASVVTVTDPWRREDAPIADGLVTDRPGLVLGVLTADCAPVLMADPQAAVVAALHAGWRGAKAGILAAGVAAMAALGAMPQRILAGVGPCLRQQSYEVDPPFRDAFLADDPASAACFKPSPYEPAKWLFDLPLFIEGQLAVLGIDAAQFCPHDTYGEAARFFSYRRSVHSGEPDYGRQLSAIALTG
mgnify:CR=1 FL=1